MFSTVFTLPLRFPFAFVPFSSVPFRFVPSHGRTRPLLTWSAVLPGAAVRVLRTVVGRRALQVGLLVGGLCVLGFLCGEQAQAAEGVGALPGTMTGRLVGPPAAPKPAHPVTAADTALVESTATDAHRERGRDTHSATAAATATATGGASTPVVPETGTSDDLTRPAGGTVLGAVTEDVVGTVADGVVRPVGDLVKPVGDLVETVTTGLTETVGIPAQPTVPGWPTLPSYPESPSWPTLPPLPGTPSVPGLPGIPGQTLPAPAPVTSAPQQSGSGGHAPEKPAGDKGSADGGAVYGPRFAGHGTVTDGTVRGSDHRTTSASTSTAHAPAHQAPSENPSGALGGKSAVDNGSSRHGDAHAITPNHRAPLRLVPGAAASVDAAGTRDRHRDIPVFPG